MVEQSVNKSWVEISQEIMVTIQAQMIVTYTRLGQFPRWLSGKESACQCRRRRRCGFSLWIRKISWGRKRQPTPVFLPGQLHGQRSLVGYSPWGLQRVRHNLVTEHAQSLAGITRQLQLPGCRLLGLVLSSTVSRGWSGQQNSVRLHGPDLGIKQAWVQAPSLSLISQLAASWRLNFLICKMGFTPFSHGLLCKLNAKLSVKCFAQG